MCQNIKWLLSYRGKQFRRRFVDFCRNYWKFKGLYKNQNCRKLSTEAGEPKNSLLASKLTKLQHFKVRRQKNQLQKVVWKLVCGSVFVFVPVFFRPASGLFNSRPRGLKGRILTPPKTGSGTRLLAI